MIKSFKESKSVDKLIDGIENDEIILDTSIQRKADQWDRKKKSLLILSAIQGIIIPEIFAKEIPKKKRSERSHV